MDGPDEPQKKISELQAMAARVRRLAIGLTQAADRERLMQHALEIETDARHLQAQAAQMPIRQQQVQQQQQQATEPQPYPADEPR